MNDAISANRVFQPDIWVVLRILEIFCCSSITEMGWTKVQNRSELNSKLFKAYIQYCMAKRFVTIVDKGHRHRGIRIEDWGRKCYEAMKKFL